MIGSNCPDPLHAQSGRGAPNVCPPSRETSSAMKGVGQLPGQGFGSP